MSDVLASTCVNENSVLVSGLNNQQLVRTAEMLDLIAIILVRGKEPMEELVEIARENNMVLMSTDYNMYNSCGMFYEHESIKVYEYDVIADDFINAGKVSSDIKKKLKDIGLKSLAVRKAAVSSYEAEINIIIHSLGGKMYLEIYDDNIVIRAEDSGPGISDIELALTQGFTTASDKARQMGFGAGMGLPNIKGYADEFSIYSDKEGTRVEIKIFFR